MQKINLLEYFYYEILLLGAAINVSNSKPTVRF
jgi:hypothetical protein